MCIKTQFKLNGSDIGHVAVRKHRAPNGALRPVRQFNFGSHA